MWRHRTTALGREARLPSPPGLREQLGTQASLWSCLGSSVSGFYVFP